ncbi:MAG: 6-phosphogluconolactonase [Actinomycetota bacterium]
MSAAEHPPEADGPANEDLHRLIIEPVEVFAERAATIMAATIAQTIQVRGRCVLAVGTGDASYRVLTALACQELAWDAVHVVPTEQLLDRRRSSADGSGDDPGPRSGDEDADGSEIAGAQISAPADDSGPSRLHALFADLPVSWLDLPITTEEIASFGRTLAVLTDDPPSIDLAVLELGPDGHTAKLLPDDPAMREVLASAALTGDDSAGRRWVTLTRPVFDRARAVLWLVAGADRAPALGRLLVGDLTMPAGLIRPRQSVVVADSDAARQA